MEENKKAPEAQIQMTDEVAQGVYSNLAIITHSHAEFILDFVNALPGAHPRVKSRIVMTPEHAKRLLLALSGNVTKYEQNFGKIHLPEESNTIAFPGIKGEA